jgi:hypothetical protein
MKAMSKIEQEKTGQKAAYEAPKVVAVSLRPEEAVLGHCKIAGSAGPVSGSCRALSCKSIGS